MTIFPHTAKCKTIFPCPQPRAPRIFPITLYWLGLWAFFSRVWASDYNTNTLKVADCGCTGAVRRAGGGIADVDRNRFAINHCCFFVYAKLSHTSITRRRRRPKSEARAKIIRGSGARKVTRAEYEWPYWKRLWRRNNRRRSRHGKRPFCFVPCKGFFFSLFLSSFGKNKKKKKIRKYPLGSIDISSHFRHQDVTEMYIHRYM